MMNKGIFLIFLLLLGTAGLSVQAQQTDSLWVKVLNGKWDVTHRIQEGESVLALAKKYEVPPALLAQENGITYNTRLAKGMELFVPIGTYNRISKAGVPGSSPVYYRTTSGDDWQRLAFLAGTSAAQLREWNGLGMGALKSGQVLLVGWVKYQSTADVQQPVGTPVADTLLLQPDNLEEVPTISKEEEQFNTQTGDGAYVNTEKGAAIYFDSKTAGSVHYAFFNLAPRGTIIKVVNPGNGHYVFAKVIGAIPSQDRYQNALIGLSLNAQKILGGKGSRTWCEVQY